MNTLNKIGEAIACAALTILSLSCLYGVFNSTGARGMFAYLFLSVVSLATAKLINDGGL